MLRLLYSDIWQAVKRQFTQLWGDCCVALFAWGHTSSCSHSHSICTHPAAASADKGGEVMGGKNSSVLRFYHPSNLICEQALGSHLSGCVSRIGQPIHFYLQLCRERFPDPLFKIVPPQKHSMFLKVWGTLKSRSFVCVSGTSMILRVFCDAQ